VNKPKVARIGAFIGSAALTAGLLAAAVAGTGAYFTDSEAGSFTGTMGTIAITATNPTIEFTNMLPGEASTHTVGYTNTGLNNQDVWVVFPQSALGDFNARTDTGLVNDRGTYAELHIAASGTPVFDSANLNDDAVSCPLGAGTPACNPLPSKILLASNVAPGAGGDMSFSWTPAAKYSNAHQGGPELSLPYTLVATQHGIAP
jgi:hypothetical protein